MECFKRTALKHVYYLEWNGSPAQVGCMRQALGPGAMGKPKREQVEREVGGGIGMGNTCKPMAVSFQCMTQSTTNNKKKKRMFFRSPICNIKSLAGNLGLL